MAVLDTTGLVQNHSGYSSWKTIRRVHKRSSGLDSFRQAVTESREMLGLELGKGEVTIGCQLTKGQCLCTDFQ